MTEIFSWTPAPDSGITMQWVEANGIRFEVAEAGDSSSEKLALCLHGFPELHYSWRHQMPVLAELGYRVWAPNMRGYGETTRPEGTKNYRLDVLAEDVGALIDGSGAKEVTLIAHDWGALVAWHFAIKKVRPLTRLVVLNCPHPKCLQREARKWRQLKKSWYIAFFQLPWLPIWFLGRKKAKFITWMFRDSAVHKAMFTDPLLEPYLTAAQKPGAIKAMVTYYRALMRMPDFRDIGDGVVDAPTLLLWGEQDVAIDNHCLDGLDEYVPDLTIKRFPDASHWVQQDVPDKVNAALREWLSAPASAQ